LPEHLIKELKKKNLDRKNCLRKCIRDCQCNPKCIPVSRDGIIVPCYLHPNGSCVWFPRGYQQKPVLLRRRANSIG
jgi:hypothetical protein